jgi:hypothetical protein
MKVEVGDLVDYDFASMPYAPGIVISIKGVTVEDCQIRHDVEVLWGDGDIGITQYGMLRVVRKGKK